MIYTGVDGEKTISVDYSLLRKSWKITERIGRRVYVIPSHMCYVRREETDIRDLYDLKRALSLEIEEKFGEVLWDVRMKGGKYCLAVVSGFEPPEDSFALDPEVFSLARVAKALGREDCYVLDIGSRKTTLVRVEGGELSSYRVVLKGTDYLKERVPEAVLKEEGLKNERVREAFGEILSSLGREITDKPVLLSGGGSRLRGIEDLFKEGFRNELVPPELNSAFGAALKFIYEDCSPTFREEELSDRDLRRVSLLLGLSLVLFAISSFGPKYLEKGFMDRMRAVEKEEFRKRFPQKPAVAVRDQVKSMSLTEPNPLTLRLVKLSEKLTEGMKVYRIEFEKGVLKVVGETKDRNIISQIGAKKVRETPEGAFEFEVEIK